MPHITKHSPKVSTRSVYPYARESLRMLVQDRQAGRQTYRHSDRQTNRHTDGLSKTTFLDVLKVVHPKFTALISNSFFHDANTSIDMDVK